MINAACRNYFDLIRHPLKEGRKCPEKILTALAIISCITVIVPAALGALYGLSACRVKKLEVQPSIHVSSSDSIEADVPQNSPSTTSISQSVEETSEDEEDEDEQMAKFATDNHLPVELVKGWTKLDTSNTGYSQTVEYLRTEWPDAEVSFFESRNMIVIKQGERKLILLPGMEKGVVELPFMLGERNEMLKDAGRIAYLVTTMDKSAEDHIRLCGAKPAVFLKMDDSTNQALNLPSVLEMIQDIFNEGKEDEEMEKFSSHRHLPIELLKRWEMVDENLYSQTAQFLREQLGDVQVNYLEAKNIIVLERGENKLVLLPVLEVGRAVFPPIEKDELEKMLEGRGRVVYLVATYNAQATQPIPLTCYGSPAIYLKRNWTKNEAENLEVVLQQLKEIFV